MSLYAISPLASTLSQLAIQDAATLLMASPKVKAAADQAARIHPGNKALQREETANILWKGYGLLESDRHLALDYCDKVLMKHDSNLANLVAANILYEFITESCSGIGAQIYLVRAKEYAERVDPARIHPDFHFQLNHILSHIYEALGHLDRAERRFMAMYPEIQKPIEVNPPAYNPEEALTAIFDKIPGLNGGQNVTAQLSIRLLILSYDLPQSALCEGEFAVQVSPHDSEKRNTLARLYSIHNRFQEAIGELEQSLRLTTSAGKRLHLEQQITHMRYCQVDPAAKTAHARENIEHYHRDALVHGNDVETFFRCLSHLQKSHVNWDLNTNCIMPFVATPRGALALAQIESHYQQSSYIELIYAQLHAHFPVQHALTAPNLYEAIHFTRRSLKIHATPGAHYLATQFFRTLALRQAMPCCKTLCTAVAERHENERQQMMNIRQSRV